MCWPGGAQRRGHLARDRLSWDLGSQASVFSLPLCVLGSQVVPVLYLTLPRPAISHWPGLAQLSCLFHFLAGQPG